MPTIPIFAEAYRFSRLITTLRFLTSKFRQIMILIQYQIKGVSPTVTLIYHITGSKNKCWNGLCIVYRKNVTLAGKKLRV